MRIHRGRPVHRLDLRNGRIYYIVKANSIISITLRGRSL